MSAPWRATLALAILASACGGSNEKSEPPPPVPTAPLPTGGLAGQRVSLFPLTLVAADESLGWAEHFANRRAALTTADSLISSLVAARAPEATWVLPDDLRRAARRSAGVAADPGQLGTAVLRNDKLVDVPDPLRSDMRLLVALVGGRYALIPAALVFRPPIRPDSGATSVPEASTATPPAGRTGTAELSIVLVDARLGKVHWRTVARGDGGDPWTALTHAVKALTPGLP